MNNNDNIDNLLGEFKALSKKEPEPMVNEEEVNVIVSSDDTVNDAVQSTVPQSEQISISTEQVVMQQSVIPTELESSPTMSQSFKVKSSLMNDSVTKIDEEKKEIIESKPEELSERAQNIIKNSLRVNGPIINKQKRKNKLQNNRFLIFIIIIIIIMALLRLITQIDAFNQLFNKDDNVDNSTTIEAHTSSKNNIIECVTENSTIDEDIITKLDITGIFLNEKLKEIKLYTTLKISPTSSEYELLVVGIKNLCTNYKEVINGHVKGLNLTCDEINHGVIVGYIYDLNTFVDNSKIVYQGEEIILNHSFDIDTSKEDFLQRMKNSSYTCK